MKRIYSKVISIVSQFVKNHRAATVIEYTLIAAAVGVAIVAVVFALGSEVTELIDDLSFMISGA